MAEYRDTALAAYGTRCEFVGCGWAAGICDVHHIDYQEHQEMENKIRKAQNSKVNGTQFLSLIIEAEKIGYGKYDPKSRQLPKDDRAHNLTVLCPNHHRYVHTQDIGMKVLNYIPTRKPGS